MTSSAEVRQLELLFRRAELATARVGTLESQLRSAYGERETVQRRLELGELQIVQMAEVNDQDHKPIGATDKYHARLLRQLKATQERVQARLHSLDLDIAAIQNELAAKEIEVEEWTDALDRRLLPAPD